MVKGLVYICSPFSGDIENNRIKAISYAKYVFNKGYIPVTPHILFPFLNEDTDREVALEMDIEILKKCEEIWVFGESITNGMKGEIELAYEKGINIKFLKCEELI